MKITILHGQNHKGSTYNLSRFFIDRIREEDTVINEFYFNNHKPCIGCYNCFMKGEEKCPHYSEVNHIINSIEQSDIIIVESPCYCMGMTGQLKIFLDHMGYRWLPHRPHPNMFKKCGVIFSTAAGSGAAKVTRDIKEHMTFWGIPRIFKYGVNVGTYSWETVSEKKKKAIEKKIIKVAAKVKLVLNNVKPTISSSFLFFIMKMFQKSNTWNSTDRDYWVRMGWLKK